MKAARIYGVLPTSAHASLLRVDDIGVIARDEGSLKAALTGLDLAEEDITVIGPAKSEALLRAAVATGARVILNSLAEARRLDAVAAALQAPARVGIRVRTAGATGGLGLAHDDEEFAALVEFVGAREHLEVVTIIGWCGGHDSLALGIAVADLGEAVARLGEVEELMLYAPMSDTAPLDTFCASFVSALECHPALRRARWSVCPGDRLFAGCGALVTTVLESKRSAGRTWVTVDAGRRAFGSLERITLESLGSAPREGDGLLASVVGPDEESEGILAESRFPELPRRGELLVALGVNPAALRDSSVTIVVEDSRASLEALTSGNPIARSSRDFIEQLPAATRAELEALISGRSHALEGFPWRLFDELNHLKIVKTLVAADGLSKEESTALDDLMDKLNLPPYVQRHIHEFDIVKVTSEDASALVRPGSQRARALINDALLVSSLDGLSAREREAIADFGEKLQLDPAQLESLIEAFGEPESGEQASMSLIRGGLTAEIVRGATLKPSTLDALWSVLTDVCEFRRGADVEAERRAFTRRISESARVCILRDMRGTPQGMWTLRETVFMINGERCALFELDQWWVREAFRGDAAVLSSMVSVASRLARKQWRSRWFMVGVGLPTSYIFLKRWVGTVWTNHHPGAPARERELLRRYIESHLGNRWDAERGLYSSIVKPPPVPGYIREREDTRRALEVYERYNPEWAEGWAMLCIAEINLRMLRRLLARTVKRAARRRR